MGAMTSVMLLNDHLQAATVIVFLVGGVILVALNYLIYHEMKENERQKQEDHIMTMTLTSLLTLLTLWLMVWGPRSALFG